MRAIGYFAEYGRCDRSDVFFPKSLPELQLAVRELVAQNKPVKFKGTGHSTAKNFCSQGGVIHTAALKGVSEIQPWNGKQTVLVEAGVTFTELTDHLAARGKSLGYTVTGFGPINVLGGIATGVHGSNTGGTSAISSRIVELDLVRPDGSIVSYSAANTTADQWRALRASLGALGGVARVRLEVEEARNLRGFSTRVPITQSITQGSLDALIEGCNYAFLMLFPANDEWVRFCGQETTAPVTSPEAVNYLFSPDVTPFEADFFQTSAQLAACSPPLEVLIEQQALSRMASSPIRIPNGEGGYTRVNDAVGPGHRMLTIDKFPDTQPRFSEYDFEFSIPYRDAAVALNYINERFDQAGRGIPLAGAVMRFDQARDDTLLGTNSLRPGVALGERIVHIEIPTYRPYSFSDAQMESYIAPYMDVMRFVAGRFPYAQFHFGKNTIELMKLPALKQNIAARVARFQAVIDAMDPYGVYANEYLEALGFRWPRRGQPFAGVYIQGDVATSAYTQNAALFSVQGNAGRCLTMAGEPGLFLDGSIFGNYAAKTGACTVSGDQANPRQRFFARDVANGKFVAALEAGRRYSLHPEDNPYVTCLNHIFSLDYNFAPCNGSTAQQFTFELTNGVGRVVAVNNGVTGCMDDNPIGDEMGTALCTPWSSSSLNWRFSAQETRSMPRFVGVGGDPYWVDRLAIAGLDLATVNTRTPAQLAAQINDPRYVVFRQRVVDNTSGAPAPGFRVCPSAPDGRTLLSGADGRGMACAYTDSNGVYTLLGLPRHRDVVLTIARKGYLQNAMIVHTSYDGYHEQEYSGVSSLAAASLGLSIDARFPFASGYGRVAGKGDASLTVVNELDSPGSRGYGVIEAGDYAGNGTGGARFRLFTDDGSGSFSIPYRDTVGNQPGQNGPDGIPDGLKYLGRSSNPLLGGSEVPTNDRVDTLAPFGGALVLSLPDGVYEAEVVKASASCFPGLDAWPGANPDRARFKVVAGYMSDVRFYCE